MLVKLAPFLALLGAITTSAVAAAHETHLPTIWMCGDSTMAKDGAANNLTDGWGQYLSPLVTGAHVVNKARAGSSARTWTTRGWFDEVVSQLTPGDVILVELGHNDGGTPERNDTGRSDCPSHDVHATCRSDADGSTVHTFVFYIVEAARRMLAAGAGAVVLSSQTPNNEWETGVFAPYPPVRFVGYMPQARDLLADERVTFVDHWQAVTSMYEKLGNKTVNGLYVPGDHTHTRPEGAKLVADAFAQAVGTKMNGSTGLVDYIKKPWPVVY